MYSCSLRWTFDWRASISKGKSSVGYYLIKQMSTGLCRRSIALSATPKCKEEQERANRLTR